MFWCRWSDDWKKLFQLRILICEYGAICTGLSSDTKLQMDPRDASTLHVVHKGGRSVWQTHDGRTTLGRKEPPKVNSHLMFEILKKYADRERWKNCTYYPLLLLSMRRCSLPSDWLATASNPAAASRSTALYTPHISVTRSLAIAEGLRDLANWHASMQSTVSLGEIDGMKFIGGGRGQWLEGNV